MARIDLFILLYLLKLAQTLFHRIRIAIWKIDSTDTAFKDKVATKPCICDFNHATSWGVARKMDKFDTDAFDEEFLVTFDLHIGTAFWKAHAKLGLLEQKCILFVDIDRYMKLLFEFCIAPDMIEMAVGVEDRHRVFDMLEYPIGCTHAWIDDKIFLIDRYYVAVGHIWTHRLRDYLQRDSLWNFLELLKKSL